MKRDKKYLLIVDNYLEMCWYKKLDNNKMMNAKIILQTYYKYNSMSKYNRVIVSNNRRFKNYKSIILEDNYIENRVDYVISFIDN